MNTHANKMKNHIFDILSEMEKTPDRFSCEERAFRRKRKFDFSTLMRFILSFGSNSLGHEIGEFFEYEQGFPTVSAFVQQRKKLSYKALEYLLHEFNRRTETDTKLYKNYRLLAIDGSDLSLPYNPLEENVIGTNRVSTLHLNALLVFCQEKGHGHLDSEPLAGMVLGIEGITFCQGRKALWGRVMPGNQPTMPPLTVKKLSTA